MIIHDFTPIAPGSCSLHEVRDLSGETCDRKQFRLGNIMNIGLKTWWKAWKCAGHSGWRRVFSPPCQIDVSLLDRI